MRLRTRLIAAAFVLVSALSSDARTRLQGYVEQGGLQLRNSGAFPIIRAGSPLTNPYAQQSYPNAQVLVCRAGFDCNADPTKEATLYVDAAGTAKANPFTASSNAFWSFYVDDGTYDIRFSGGGITVPFTWSSIVVNSGTGVYVSVTGVGALCDGSTDDTVAIQAALDIATSVQPVTIQLPAATCKFTSQLLIDVNRTRVIGVGSYTSNLLFVPASGGISAFKAQNSAAGTVISSITFMGFRLYSTETSLQKIAFDVVDGSFITFDDVVVGPEDMWKGAGTSIGIKLRGRELINIRNSSIWANDGVALSIQPNPNDTRDGDYLIVENSVFSGDKTASTTQPVINVLSNVQLTRSAFRDINTSYGGWAFYWVDGASATSSDSLSFYNFHWEQSKNASGVGELIRIDKTGSSRLFDFSCIHCGTGGAQLPNGIYLRNVDQALISQLFFASSSTGVPLNVSTTNGLTLRNQFSQTSSSNVMTDMRRVRCTGRATISATTTCTEEVWESTANTNLKESFVIWDVPFYTETGTLASGASASINMVGGTLKVGIIEAVSKGATVTAGGSAILHSGGAQILGTGLNFDDADTGGNLCVVWTSASVANLKNNTGESTDYAFVIWYRK